MQLLIISATERKSYAVEWLEINTAEGNFVIQSDHAPTILVLAPESLVTYLPSGEQTSVNLRIKQAVVEITREQAILIITQNS